MELLNETNSYLVKKYLKCISTHRRRLLLNLVIESERINVTDLVIKVNKTCKERRYPYKWDQSSVSVMLALFKKRGLVNLETEGKTHYYSPKAEKVKELNRVLAVFRSAMMTQS